MKERFTQIALHYFIRGKHIEENLTVYSALELCSGFLQKDVIPIVLPVVYHGFACSLHSPSKNFFLFSMQIL